ncbi:class III poly(R)-hydroxyalkanoic acid synthase subunit PhaE [Deferrisoma sp.]
MNWAEEMQQAAKTWTDWQKAWWEQWTPRTGAEAGKGDGPWAAWVEEWRRNWARALETWTGQRRGLPPQVIRSLFAGEEVFFRFVEFVTQGLRTLAPRLEAGEDWSDLLRRYVEQVKKDLEEDPLRWLPSAQGAAQTARELPELWRLWASEAQKLALPWLRSAQESRGYLGEAMTGDRAAVLKMINVFWDTYQNTLGRYLAAPAIGYTREFQEKFTRAYETWLEMQKAQGEFQVEITNAGIRALETMLRELVERAEKGKPITSARQLFDLWVACAERAYFEVASTESFARIQGRFVNAAMHYKVHERQLVEEFARAFHLPTRTELDDAYRHLHELRREVRTLRRELEALKAEKAAAPAEPAPPRRARRAAKPAADTKPGSPAKAEGSDSTETKEG